MRHGPLSVGLSMAALATAAAALALRTAPRSAPPTESTAIDSVAAAARDSYALLDPRQRHRADQEALLALHGEEIGRTFAVAGVLIADSIAVALVRYSIGPRVYHDAHWLRRVGPRWHPTADLSPLKDSDDPFGDGDAERARLVIDSATAWLEEGARRWW